MKVFFATDIHGSEVCWRKFLNSAAFYKADLVVLGGDVTGKVMIPIVARQGYYHSIPENAQKYLDPEEWEIVWRHTIWGEFLGGGSRI